MADENTSSLPFSVSSTLLSIRLRTLSTHWADCFSDVDFSDPSNQSILRSFMDEHTKNCTELQEKLIAVGEQNQQIEEQTDTTITAPPSEPIRILGNVTPQEINNLQRRKTIQSSSRTDHGTAHLTTRTTLDTSSHHPSDEGGDVGEDYTQYLDLHDDDEEESLLIDDDDDNVWKQKTNRIIETGPRVVSLDPTRTSSRSHFNAERNSPSSSTRKTLERPCYQKREERSLQDGHSISSNSTYTTKKDTAAVADQSLLRRDSSSIRSGYEPGMESMLEYSSSIDDESPASSSAKDVSETHYHDSDEESNPAPTVIARPNQPDDDEDSVARLAVDERSKASRTVLRNRVVATPKLSSKQHAYPTSLIKENLMSPGQSGNNVSCLTNASFLSHCGPNLETVEEDDTLSVETPVLDRYRIEPDDNSPHGFKVVPNPRGLHRRRRQKPLTGTIRREDTSPTLSGYGRNGTTASPHASDSALLLYTQARMATARPPSVRSITPSEYHAAPRLVHLQTPLEDLNRAIATINTTIADQAKSHHSVIQHVHISESQALQMLGCQVLLRTLCHFGRLQVRDSSEDRIFDVALDGP